jgi:hypothetical protein
MLFTCVVPHTKNKGLLIDVPYHLSYAFYRHGAPYKK